MHLYFMYRLKPDVDFDRYRAWSLERDQPVTGGREGIESFHVYAVESPDGSGAYDVVEHVEVADWETWEQITRSGPNVAIGQEFAELVDVDSLVQLAGHEIVPAA